MRFSYVIELSATQNKVLFFLKQFLKPGLKRRINRWDARHIRSVSVLLNLIFEAFLKQSVYVFPALGCSIRYNFLLFLNSVVLLFWSFIALGFSLSL